MSKADKRTIIAIKIGAIYKCTLHILLDTHFFENRNRQTAFFETENMIYMIWTIYLRPYHMDYIIWHHFDSDRWILISLNRRFTR